MARRLSASRSSSSPPVLKGQTFEVVCDCGETLTGPRELDHQAIECPHCGKSLFILPADYYAEAPSRRRLHSLSGQATASERMIDKLNRLAFWARLKEHHRAVGTQFHSLIRRVGQWVKRQFGPQEPRTK